MIDPNNIPPMPFNCIVDDFRYGSALGPDSGTEMGSLIQKYEQKILTALSFDSVDRTFILKDQEGTTHNRYAWRLSLVKFDENEIHGIAEAVDQQEIFI